ncbi:MAG: BamA/TamA family outer membrane protein [Acidobacteria bacterium]|nr:BamA/TamA family outer membrane protein [Acidobacteriota bacterium]
MRLRHIVAVVGCAALLLARTASADVADYLGKPVVSVTLQSEGRPVNDTRIAGLVATGRGRALSMREVRESIIHLFSLGIYEDVQVRAAASGAGVALVFELVPLHPVQSMAFTGTDQPGVDEDTLRQALTDRFGRSPRAARARDMAQAIAEVLRDDGYLRATVTPRVEVHHDPDRTSLTFSIEAGPRARLGTIGVEGSAGMSDAALLSELEIATGQPWERSRLMSRIERVLTAERRKGYYEARLAATPTFSDDGRTVALRLTAFQGPKVRVVFQGDPVPNDRRDELVPIAREGSADEDLLEDSSNRIEEFFRTQGYRDAAAPHTREQREGELVVTFAVKKGPQYRVSALEIAGNSALSTAQLTGVLRVRAGQPFSSASLDADLVQIEEAYRRLGYAGVRADATTAPGAAQGDQVPVTIRIEVLENAQTIVNSMRIEGNAAVDAETLLAGLALSPGQPFSVARLAADRDAIELKYANLGYQSATVDSRPGLSSDSRRADVVFTVREGPRVFVDHVLIVGNTRTRTDAIERELQVKAGEPLGLEALSESQRRLAAMGLFRRARITQLGRGDDPRRDVLVTVEEAPLTTVGWGGGFEVRSRVVRSASDPNVASEKLEFAPRASFEIGRRNLFGTNRSVNLFTSASLHPKDSPVFANQDPSTLPDAGGWGFPQYRVLGQFRQPRILRSRADFRVTGTVEQQIRSSFNFSRRSVVAELAVRLPRNVSASGGYQIQRTRVFNQSVAPEQQRTIDRLFPKVRLSSFLGSVIRDTRNDPVDPTAGQYFSANGQLAGRAIGSEVGFMKSFFTAQTFRTLPGRRGVVFAASARLGAAVGFPNAAGSRDLPASERFFAGGDTTVRGFALDRLGVSHTPARESDTIDEAGFPLGGNALLIFNGEFRIPLRSAVKLVTFADVGNVYKTIGEVSVNDLRPALGIGFRYKSPVGPLRFDLGFKVPRREDESRTQWFITFGEAF